jgi:hypothetical protein
MEDRLDYITPITVDQAIREAIDTVDVVTEAREIYRATVRKAIRKRILAK